MLHQLCEIPRQMLARTAAQPSVLIVLIQCVTMATADRRVAIENGDEEVEENSTLLQGEIGSSETFSTGTRKAQFRKDVRFNNHLLY